jgi:nicotinate dehydrogenase subunit B
MRRRWRDEEPRDDFMTARAARCKRAGFSRRDFLKTSGALIVGFSVGALEKAAAQFGAPVPGSPSNQVDSWIAIAADGSVTAYSGKEELGQGISTAQTQLVAEELAFRSIASADLLRHALTPDQAYTAGSQSHPANFNHSNLAQAGATAREALFRMASQRLGAPVDQLTAAMASSA